MKFKGKSIKEGIGLEQIGRNYEYMDDEILYDVTDQDIQFSQAVSLKRIADALTGMSQNDLINLAWEMGRNFGHGMEQGRRQ